jgi:hypothetical protein
MASAAATELLVEEQRHESEVGVVVGRQGAVDDRMQPTTMSSFRHSSTAV